MDRWIDGEGVRVSTVKQPQLLRHEAEYAVCWMRVRWERTFASSVFFFLKGAPSSTPRSWLPTSASDGWWQLNIHLRASDPRARLASSLSQELLVRGVN